MADENMQDQTVTPPDLNEIAPIDDPTNPLRLDSYKAANYANLLLPSDSILRSKGSASNLSIYRELLRDDQVSAAWSQRRLALTSCDFVVEPGADDAASKAAAEALDLELRSLAWDDVTDKALFSVFYGWGVAECLWKVADNGTTPAVSFASIKVRDRARFRFDHEGKLYLWTTGSGWVEMPERKFWVMRSGADNHDELYGLGLAHQLYWPVFFKRNDIKFWLVFLEKFGMPTALAKLPAGDVLDKEKLRKAQAMLRQIATDAGVVVPDTTVVELLEAARSGAADYQSLHDAMNAAISKIVIGQTATTEGTPGRLGSDKTQQDVAQTIVEADSDLLANSFNEGPARWWCEWNFPGATPPRVYRVTEPEEDLNARAERDKKISELGFEPEEDYITETYGKGWKKKQAPAVDPAAVARGLMQDPGRADPAQFSEQQLAALAALKAARRGDQQALVEAAQVFAEQHDGIMGRQVGALLQAAEFSEDYGTFRARLAEIMEQGPAPELVDKIDRAGFFARLLGAFRAQRR